MRLLMSLLAVPLIAQSLHGAAKDVVVRKPDDGRLLVPAESRAVPDSSRQRDSKVEALLERMSLEEKIGQMVQVNSKGLESQEHIRQYLIGSVLSGASSDPADNLPTTWIELANSMQSQALQTRLQIPLLYGIDAVHGHNNIDGAVIFPHNIGLGATDSPALVEAAARITALEVADVPFGMHPPRGKLPDPGPETTTNWHPPTWAMTPSSLPGGMD
jgi:beta-glucosidase